MKKLLKFLKGYTKETVLGPLFKLFEAVLELIVPLVIAAIIDNGINAKGGADIGFIVKMCLLLVFLGAVGLAFSIIAQYYAAKASCGFVAGMKSSLFAHIGTLSYSEIDKIGTSTLITRMTTDANQVQTGLNLTLRLLLRSPLVVFGAMIMAFTIDTEAAIPFVVVIPALCAVVFGIMLSTIPLYKKVQARLDTVLAKTRENLSGVRVLRAFCKEDDEVKEYRESTDALTSAQKFVGRISALMNPLTYILINFAILFLIYTGAVRVNSGELTQGEVVALYNYMAQILVELVKFANLIITITKALASASRIQAVFDTESSMIDGNMEFCGIGNYGIEFRNVSFRYGDAAENSLEKISFSAGRGDTIGIIGGTGSGKTSLINLIPRFYDATEGEVLIGGKSIKCYTAETLREKIGIVPQNATLFSGSIRDNMAWGNHAATDVEIMRAIKIAQAENVVTDKGGLDAEIEAGGKNLSGGQRQRLTIARALVKNPEILILDDSASALDFATDAALRRALRDSTAEATVFIVSQRASSVMYADKIIVLDDGAAVGIGTHDELISSCPVYKEIYDTQFSDKEVR